MPIKTTVNLTVFSFQIYSIVVSSLSMVHNEDLQLMPENYTYDGTLYFTLYHVLIKNKNKTPGRPP